VIAAGIGVGVYFAVRGSGESGTALESGTTTATTGTTFAASGQTPGAQEGKDQAAPQPIRVGDEFGYIDTGGEVVIEPQFSLALPFDDGLAAVKPKEGDLYGFIDTTGELVIQPQFCYAGDFSEGLALVRTESDDPWGYYIDTTGKIVRQE
jgi:hypothetical protein